jgi:hypothetical protein
MVKLDHQTQDHSHVVFLCFNILRADSNIKKKVTSTKQAFEMDIRT